MASKLSVPEGVRITAKVAIPAGLDYLAPKRGAMVIRGMQQDVMKAGRLLQREAVKNASGRSVTYNGGTFKIMRQTGNLVRNIHPPVPGPLSATVTADAAYAAAVEEGHGAIDLKKANFKSPKRIVPLPVGKNDAFMLAQYYAAPRSKGGLGMKVYRSSDSHGKPVSTVNGLRTQSKYGSTGRTTGSRSVMFRRVPLTGSGWIIPAAKPRPFMAAAAETVEPILAKAVAATFLRVIGFEED